MATRAAKSLRLGFTLVELMVVIALVAMIMAIAMPNLWPIIAFSEHEGAARRLAQYGRAATSHAVLARETITVNIDIENGEYWCTRLPEPEPEESDSLPTAEEEERERRDVPEDDGELLRLAQQELEEGSTGRRPDDSPQSDVLLEQSDRLSERLNERARRGVESRAKLVNHKTKSSEFDVMDRFLAEREEEKLRREQEEDLEPEEVKDNLLLRAKLPDQVFFQRVLVNDEEIDEEIVEIEITPLGLSAEVKFYLEHFNGDVFTVTWDPLTGGAAIIDGDDAT